jgi:hypothetical protein
VKITAFHPSHFGAINPDYRFRELVESVTPEYLAALAGEPSITIWCEDVPVAVGGVSGGVEGWALFDAERARRHKFAIIRAIRRYIATFPYLYVNCAVPIDCKLHENLLGFRQRQGHPVKRGDRSYIHLERIAS